LAERDVQTAVADSAAAVKLGKLANLGAMIYGAVEVSHRDERASRTVIDIIGRGVKKEYYTKRYCQATVSFSMTNIHTGKTLASVSTTYDYDSEEDKDKSKEQGIGDLLGFGKDELPPTEKVISHLIDRCVQEFLSKITPHTVTVTEELPKGKTKFAETGRKLAIAGEYVEALESFQIAIEKRKDDHASMFSAGVMCEALGRFKDAESYYTQAFKTDPEEQYVLARARVRDEMARQDKSGSGDDAEVEPDDEGESEEDAD